MEHGHNLLVPKRAHEAAAGPRQTLGEVHGIAPGPVRTDGFQLVLAPLGAKLPTAAPDGGGQGLRGPVGIGTQFLGLRLEPPVGKVGEQRVQAGSPVQLELERRGAGGLLLIAASSL